MSKIVVLDDNMINMIAAGEVIERPASVVKELLENAIDAGATKIVLKVEDGGRKLISVTDNGGGIDGEDIEKAFLPHATSKLKCREDLFNISTMGFRGEALASIAQVSKTTLTSRTADSIQANTISIDCGVKEAVRPCSGDVGTTIEVRDLFYKLPARRKFLRTSNTEMSHITEHFTRIGLSHCNLDLTLIHNNRQLYKLSAGQSRRKRIEELFSTQIAADLLETKSSERGVEITALLGKPCCSRGNNKFQYVFLNKRCIKDKFISHALKEAYRGLLEPNKHPIVFLFLQIDPADFDVNVHPTKTEVRFVNSNLIHSQVLAVMREKLLSTNLDVKANLSRPVIGVDGIDQLQTPEASRKERITAAMGDFFKNHKSGGSTQKPLGFGGSHRVGENSAGSYERISNAHSFGGRRTENFSSPPAATEPISDFGGEDADATSMQLGGGNFLQIHNSYILMQTEEGFEIIDQHALHERIIYEEMTGKLNRGKLVSQRMLIPETFDVTDVQRESIESNLELIGKLGIELEPFGPSTMAIQSFPVMLEKVNPLDFVTDLLDKLCDKNLGLDAELLVHEVLDMAACKAAIKAGQPLSQSEMRQLLKDKETTERSSRCPHGRPTTIRFTMSDLEKQFKRTGF
ncbi:MAG: DNA mismatch repair endonuclease MutL [Phycisphaerae bacterium]|nr:DNA mismatch repair endonuclease MutL [Phycisphaerae bacterium]